MLAIERLSTNLTYARLSAPEEAFPLAAKAWDTELLVKKYWLISNERLFPNFVIQRIKNKVAFHYGMVVTVAIIATFLASNYLIENPIQFKYGIYINEQLKNSNTQIQKYI